MISLNGRDLTIEQVIRVTRGYEEVKIAEEAKAPMDKARAYVEEKVASGAAIYGLTTGFGKFQDKYLHPRYGNAAKEPYSVPRMRHGRTVCRGYYARNNAFKMQCALPRQFRHTQKHG